MTTDSFFSIACISILAMFFGFVMAFSGYRFFLFLLPIWGFFFGFGFGAQTVQAIFGTGFLSDITSWVVGFFVALVFAVLSYLFYFVAVALLAGSLGYALGTGLMMAIGFDFNFIVWIVGIVVAVIIAAVVILFNVQKYVIIFATAILGAGVIVGAFLFLFGGLPSAQLFANPVRVALQSSPWWTVIFIIVAAVAVVAQLQTTRAWKLESYNRYDTMMTPM